MDKLSYYLEFIKNNPKFILLGSFGLILIIFGGLALRNGLTAQTPQVMVLEENADASKSGEIVAEVGGSVERPGVYKLPVGSRINDLLIAAGGISQNADRVWIEKTLNRAAKISDGQKIYIRSLDDTDNSQSPVSIAKNASGDQTISSEKTNQGSGLVNINDASAKELDALPGIGQVYAQKIIDHRPYSNTEELLTKGVLKKNTYEDIKDKITI